MAFLHLGGDGGARPTYFEVYAADKLVPALKAAVLYSLSVLGASSAGGGGGGGSWLVRALRHEDEAFALVALLLERHSLAQHHATFAESVYGLKRAPAPPPAAARAAGGEQQQLPLLRRLFLQARDGLAPPAPAAASAAAPLAQQQPQLLGARGLRLALLAQVLLPYLKAKADQLYASQAAAAARAPAASSSSSSSSAASSGGLLGLAALWWRRRRRQVRGGSDGDAGDAGGGGGEAPPAPTLAGALRAARRGALAAFVAGYPWVHAAVECTRFAYQLLYLLDAVDCHDPVLHLLGQRLVRLTGPETVAMERDKQQRRQAALARAAARRPAALARASGWWLRGGALAADHLRTALVLAVFGFKILEWWYTSAEERLAAAAALPPPPPPPAPAPHPGGVGLPKDVALCPLCRQKRVNPALLAASGYVFCYPCLFRHVADAGCCPVSRLPASLDHIRRLYEAM